MEQARGEHQQQEQPPTPLRCPRCNSLDTRFRYFNNHSPTQPRHSCKTCKRQWTVGGNLRNVPIGGKPRSAKQTKASSSRSVNSRCQLQQSPLPFVQEYLQDSPFLEPMVAQNFNSSIIQHQTILHAPISTQSTYLFNDEISCLDAIQSLIQPEAHVNAGNQFGNIGANMGIPQEWNIQPTASQEPISQRLTGCLDSHQNYNQVNDVPHSQLFDISLAQPTRPINSLPKGIPTDLDVSTSNLFMGNNNFMGNMTDPEIDTTSVNVDEWLNLSDHE